MTDKQVIAREIVYVTISADGQQVLQNRLCTIQIATANGPVERGDRLRTHRNVQKLLREDSRFLV